MLIPKEKSYLDGLNSYYLQLERFVEHLQGEIGSGCLHCQAAEQELLIYFDEQEILRSVVQNRGESAQVSTNLLPIFAQLAQKSFQVTVYYLDSSSIFFWGQLPDFKRDNKTLQSTDISLASLVSQLCQKNFSGFIEVGMVEGKEAAILFYHEGERKIASYSWGQGGGSLSNEDFEKLLKLTETGVANFSLGQFRRPSSSTVYVEDDEDDDFLSSLEQAIKEFLAIFIKIVEKRSREDALVLLKQVFLDHIDEYEVLDPFRGLYQIAPDGTVLFSKNVPKIKIVTGIVDCAWMVVEKKRLQKKFRKALHKWDYRIALEERGIEVER